MRGMRARCALGLRLLMITAGVGLAAAEIPAGMSLIPGGTLLMGSNDAESRANERPRHTVAVAAFLIDTHAVTNAQFAAFVAATGYRTTAERAPDWEELRRQLPPGTPRPDPSVLVAGSLVFTATAGPVDRRDPSAWWRWMPGADWRHPEGPPSTIAGREQHPVVQVSWHDAVAYAAWAGKRLPSEAEWEYAARGGLSEQPYAWGAVFRPAGRAMANTWDGSFPYRNTGDDGFVGTAPVGSFPANGYGLFDMGGNVWNWCADAYAPYAGAETAITAACHANPATAFERVTKGGSFLCHADYCASYRPAARRGTPADTGMAHIGFRCARDP
jgi:formylglycine-generating enzyme required for sulfatase activity